MLYERRHHLLPIQSMAMISDGCVDDVIGPSAEEAAVPELASGLLFMVIDVDVD